MQVIPIYCASDDNYAPFLCSTMFSVLQHTEEFIEFNVLDGGIKEKSKKLIEQSLEKFKNYSLNYIDMSSYNLSQFPNLRHYSLNTFSRYFIPQLDSKNNKVLYIDIDIIVKNDIARLYNQDLENYPLGAILEDFYSNGQNLREKVYPDYKNDSFYFNAGILVIDIKYWRENNISKQLIEMTIEYADKILCADQDILNIVFEQNYKILDYIYNYMPDHYDRLKAIKPERTDFIRDNALIIHYTSTKPWKGKSAGSKYFWPVYKKTAFYNENISIVDKSFEILDIFAYERGNNIIKCKTKSKKKEYTFSRLLKNIFSIKNSSDKRHKVITLLGIRVKLRRKKDKELQKNSSTAVNAVANDGMLLFKENCKEKKKLNLGCGSTFHEDWVQLDFTSSKPGVFAHNLLQGIPCDDNTLDIVYHSHVLEHFSKKDGIDFIKECYRVLKPNGILRIAIPDLEQIVKLYLQKLEERNEDDYTWMMIEMYDQCVRNTSGGDMLKYFQQENIANLDFVLSRIGSEGENLLKKCKKHTPKMNTTSEEIGKFRLGGQIHQWMYDRFSLELLLTSVGFKDFKIQNANTSSIENFNDYKFDFLDGKVRKPESLFVEARK